MTDKVLNLQEVIAQIHSGDTIAIGGWGPTRKPMALLKAIVRSKVKDLTVISFAGIDLDMLVGAGKVKKAIYPFVSLEGAPGAIGNFRRARQEASIDFMELSEYMVIAGLKAAANRLPFYPTRSGLGTDILTMNPDIEVIEAPYTKEKLVAMPPLEPDVALIHVNTADPEGNAQILGDPFCDYIIVKAAKKVFLSCEKIVSTIQLKKDPGNVVIKSPWVAGVVETVRGAHPGSCYPNYNPDEAHLKEYGSSTADPEAFKAYLDKYI